MFTSNRACGVRVALGGFIAVYFARRFNPLGLLQVARASVAVVFTYIY